MLKRPNTQLNIFVDHLSPQGDGVGKIAADLGSVQAPQTLVGEEVVVELTGRKKGMYIGRTLHIVNPSQDRTQVQCPHLPACGGCSLQHMHYAAQASYKEKIVRNIFHSFSPQTLYPIIPASSPWAYRNKMEFTFSQDREGTRFLGLMRRNSKGRVEEITDCRICPAWFHRALNVTRTWWQESALRAYHPFSDTGSLRTLTLRSTKNTKEKMVILTVSGRAEFALSQEHMQDFVQIFRQEFSSEEENVSIFVRIQQSIPGRETQFYEMKLWGADRIREYIEIRVSSYHRVCQFAISPTAFFQPNTQQAEKIYAAALAMAGLHTRKWVLDLYAGTATLGVLFAPFAENIVSIENNPYAVFDAEHNKEENGVSHLQIIQGDVAKVLQESMFVSMQPDLILLDPPRSGLSPQALEQVVRLRPKEILYISCNVHTQVTDCHKLSMRGYLIDKIQPIDQFPHTMHMENIVLLRYRE